MSERAGWSFKILVPRLDRHVEEIHTVIRLHVFGEASERAFCSVAHFRFSYADRAAKCSFVTAKTHVAPKKPLSISRDFAVLSARLSCDLTKEEDYKVDSTYLWTDSSMQFVLVRSR